VVYEPGSFLDLADTATGRRLWRFLTSPETIVRMETASELGRPAIEPLALRLIESFGQDIKGTRWKQVVGHMVRQIMEHRGFHLDAQGVRIRGGALFMSGSRYLRYRRVRS